MIWPFKIDEVLLSVINKLVCFGRASKMDQVETWKQRRFGWISCDLVYDHNIVS